MSEIINNDNKTIKQDEISGEKTPQQSDENKKPIENPLLKEIESLKAEIEALKKPKEVEKPKQKETQPEQKQKSVDDLKEEIKRDLFFEDLDKEKLDFIKEIPGYEVFSVAQLKAILKKFTPVKVIEDDKKKQNGIDIQENKTKQTQKTKDQMVNEVFNMLHPEKQKK